jgi:5-methylcytosine-specific restriction endonuclease McrA
MRRVDRTLVPVPASLHGPASPAARERERAAQHFRTTPEEVFTFREYKRQDVADALNVLFHGKCAYCESYIKAVQPTDIEHFRPKGRVADCPTHPGYWWLAASWDNLLASCIDCNRRRYHHAQQLAHDPLDGEVNGLFYLGKGDLFPILGPQYALTEADDLDAEDAALIDPTRRDPKAHLVWLQEEGLSLVGPRMVDGNLDLYGQHTYRVFGLNRQGLVELRTTRLLEIRSQIVFIEKMLDRAIILPEPFASQQSEDAFKQLFSLYKYAGPEEPFSAMVEDLLDDESDRLTAKYQELADRASA